MNNMQVDFGGTWRNDFQDVNYSDEKSGNLAFSISLGGKLVSKGSFYLSFIAEWDVIFLQVTRLLQKNFYQGQA